MEQNFLFFLLLFIISFILVLIATPIFSKIAVEQSIIDQPGRHKTHQKAKPLLGGLAIFLSISITLLIFLEVDDKLLPMILATVVLILFGLIDDIYNIKPLLKLAGQTVAASIVVLWDVQLYSVLLNYFSRFHIPHFIVLTLIIGWIVLMINAFNLIDGLDGLATGTAAIILLAMAVLSILTGGNPNILGVQLIGLGACLGFLIYNFNPSRIFMGDTGSMMLGFILATIHLFTIKYPFSAPLVLGSIYIFAYPALDIAFAIYRRVFNRSSLFKADRGHIHHILLGLGFSVRKTVLIIYAANAIFALIAVVLLSLEIPAQVLLGTIAVTALGVVVLFRYLMILSGKKDNKLKTVR